MNIENCVEKSIELNGRRVAFTIYGDPSLRIPVIYHHGFPGSRREAQLCARSASALGVSVIAIDRPGLGGSDYAEGRTLLDWPPLLEGVADYLGLKSFHVIGVSGGAPYALAAAHTLSHRVLATAIVSGMAEAAANPDLLYGMAPGNKVLLKFATHMPLFAHYSVAAIAAAWRHFPALGLCWLRCFMPSCDKLMLEDVSTKYFLYGLLENAFFPLHLG